MRFITVLTFLAVLVTPSIQSWGGGSTSNTDKTPNYERGINCFSRCRDAYLHNKDKDYTRGCACARYDLSAFKTDEPSSPPCDCPSGTICLQENGKTTCEPEPKPVPQPLPKSLAPFVPKPRPRPLPEPRIPEVTGHQRRGRPIWDGSLFRHSTACGYLAPSCCAHPRTYTYVYRYTFDHDLGMCVRRRLVPSCAHMYGVHANIFHNYRQCSRQCLVDMKY